MNYGTIKVDQITFTNAGVDQTLSVSGIVQSISGGITVTGTVQGETVIGTSTVSGATVTGNTGEFTSITAATGVFTSYISGLTITGDSAQFITVTGGSAGFTTITGATVTGTTANFATLSGQTITGGHVTTASGTYTGNVTAAAFVPTGSSIPTNGVYLPAANSVALSTNGTGRLFVDASGNVGVGVNPSTRLHLTGTADQTLQINGSGTAAFVGTSTAVAQISSNRNPATGAIYDSGRAVSYINLEASPGNGNIQFYTTATNNVNATERLRITSAGLVGIGTSSPSYTLDVEGQARVSTRLRIDGSSSGDKLKLSGITTGAIYADITNTGNTTIIGNEQSTGGALCSGGLAYATVINAQSARPLQLATSNTARLTISSTGLVGIGTTSPATPLHIQSSTGTQLTLERTSTVSAYAVECLRGARDSQGLYTDGTGIGLRADDATNGATSIGLLGSNVNSNDINRIQFNVYGSERARIDSSGRLLVGTSSWSGSNLLTIQGNASTSAGAGELFLARGESAADMSSGDLVSRVSFGDQDDNDYARIECQADGTPAANDYPGRLVFSTTADGASSPTERMRVQADGNVRIGNASTLYPAADNSISVGISGNRWSAIWAANGTIQTSDQRTKTDVAPAALGTDFIKALRPVSYKWIEGGQVDSGKRDDDGNYIYESVPGKRTHWGFIAQEVKQAVDAAGVDFGGWVLTDKDDPDSQQALRYDQFIAPLTKALQETMAELVALKAEVAALKAQ